MSIASTIKDAVTGTDTEVAGALDRLAAARAQGESITDKLAAANTKLRDQEKAITPLALAAEAGDVAPYEKAKAGIASTRETIDRLRLALEGTRIEITDAQAALDALNHDRVMRGVQRKANERDKAAAQYEAAIADLAKAHRKLYGATEQLTAILPATVSVRGMLISVPEIQAAIALELRRAHIVEPTIRSVAPLLPGAESNPLLNVKKLPPLTDVVAAANKYLLERVAQVGTSEGPKGKSKLPPRAALLDPDGLDTPQVPQGRAVTAAEVMATSGPSKQLA